MNALKRDNGDVQHPVALDGVDGILPAGSYTIETEEELIEMLSFEAYRRVSTTISLPSIGTACLKRQIVDIDPLGAGRSSSA